MSLGRRFIVVGQSGQIRIFDPLTNTFSGAKTSGTSNTLTHVDGDSIGNVIFAGGASATLLKSTDGGETWESLSGLTGDVNGLRVISAREVYIGTDNSNDQIYFYDGENVSLIHTFAGSTSIYDIFGGHNDILIANEYNANMHFGLHYLQNGGSVTGDNSLNSGAEVDVFAGIRMASGTNLIYLSVPGPYYRAYVGSASSWAIDKAFDLDYYHAPMLTHNQYTGVTHLKVELGYDSVIKTRSSIGDWTTSAVLGHYVNGTRIACLEGPDTVVAVPLSSTSPDGSILIWNGVSATKYTVGASFTGQFKAAFSPRLSYDDGSSVETSILDGEEYGMKIENGDLILDDRGNLYRDYTPESQCTFRLMCRRGEYWADPTMGSRLHTIKTLKDAKRKVKAYVDEALKPLLNEGTIDNVSVGEYIENADTGMLAVQILIDVPSKSQSIDLGLIPLGGL